MQFCYSMYIHSTNERDRERHPDSMKHWSLNHDQAQGMKISTASAIDALQLAEVPSKIYPYSRPKWPVPPHTPDRGAPLGSDKHPPTDTPGIFCLVKM